jgi:antitoxin YefM
LFRSGGIIGAHKGRPIKFLIADQNIRIPRLTTYEAMTRILVMSETLPLSSVKARFSELVDRVEDQHERVVVTRNGKMAAVLISHDDLESLEETLAILSDPALMEQIQESERTRATQEPATTLAELRAGLQRRRNAAA